MMGEIATAEAATIERAARLVAGAVAHGGLVHLFGAGHSQLLAEEGFFRAGGLACVNPLLVPELAPRAGPLASIAAERDVRSADLVFARYRLVRGDVLIVFSNSGISAVPVEVSRRARLATVHVIGVASKRYMAEAAPSHPEGLKLQDVVDVLIDNHGVPGDAILTLPGLPVAVGPSSTITGALILHAVLVEAVAYLSAQGIVPPIYLSGKVIGADAHNAALLDRYRDRIPLLAS